LSFFFRNIIFNKLCNEFLIKEEALDYPFMGFQVLLCFLILQLNNLTSIRQAGQRAQTFPPAR
jgi:hypothetical protein